MFVEHHFKRLANNLRNSYFLHPDYWTLTAFNYTVNFCRYIIFSEQLFSRGISDLINMYFKIFGMYFLIARKFVYLSSNCQESCIN